MPIKSFVPALLKNNSPWGQPPHDPSGGKGPGRDAENIDKAIEELQRKMRGAFGGGGSGKNAGGNKGGPATLPAGGMKWIIIFAIIAIAVMDMFYIVKEGSEAVILRLGAYHRTVGPGPHFRLPSPLEKDIQIDVETIRTDEIGFRSANKYRSTQKMLQESLMLTGDENIVNTTIDVQWKIKDPHHYLFNVRDLNTPVIGASALRAMIGEAEYLEVISGNGRDQVAKKTQKLLQSILDSYEAGVQITSIQIKQIDPPAPVIDAFRDVQTAELDRETKINKARAYENQILPKARGRAQEMLNKSEAYKQEVIARATGDASRFKAVYKEYVGAKDVTKKRMYLETMESILRNMDKTILDTGNNNVVPYLPLNQLNAKK